MRVCTKCRKVGAGVDRCADRSKCAVIDRGVIIVPVSDVLTGKPREGELIEMVTLPNQGPVPGDAAPRVYVPSSPPGVLSGELINEGLPAHMRATPGGQEGEPVVPAGILPTDDDSDDDCPTTLKPKEVTSGTMAGSILSEAAGIVEGARNAQHGNKERSFEAIARMWTAYLMSREMGGTYVRAEDVAQMMVLTKMMRAEWGTPIRDHYVDAAGYSGIAGEIALAKQKHDTEDDF